MKKVCAQWVPILSPLRRSRTWQTIATLGAPRYTVLPHPPYSPDLAPSDYVLFDAMKNVMRGKTFSNNELQAVVQHWHQDTRKNGLLFKYRTCRNEGRGAWILAGNTSNIICIYFVPIDGYCEEKTFSVNHF
ncbi:hypothetical protein B7P43_G17508 [Cryptotermes secundus]|uniref:Histone-lysine N-methyltransferase SETMAR n=1 Tax=Cryptotermes secundus TaxID=105785 RepID=A0A2J7Q185_9NEOP|nr:hypothetical protein B7P43_G17508 [Cryptotermes secundus]